MGRPSLVELAARRNRKTGPAFQGMPSLLLALRECLLGGAAKRIASRIRGKALSSVYAEADGDALSWLEEGVIWMEESLAAGTPPEQALAPITFLVGRFFDGDGVAAKVDAALSTCKVAECLRMSAEGAERVLRAVRPDGPGGPEITPEELPECEQLIDRNIARWRELRLLIQARAGRGRTLPALVREA